MEKDKEKPESLPDPASATTPALVPKAPMTSIPPNLGDSTATAVVAPGAAAPFTVEAIATIVAATLANTLPALLARLVPQAPITPVTGSGATEDSGRHRRKTSVGAIAGDGADLEDRKTSLASSFVKGAMKGLRLISCQPSRSASSTTSSFNLEEVFPHD